MQDKLAPGQFCGEVLKRQAVNGFILTETRYSPGLRVPKHSHEDAYFTLVRQGGFTETYGKKTRTCRPLTLAFHPSDEVHSEHFASIGGRAFNLEIEPGWLKRLREHAPVLEHPADFQGGPLLCLGLRLHHEFHHIDAVSSLVIEGLVLELLAEASRRVVENSDGRPPRWLAQAREMLHARFAETLKLTDIAEPVGVHPVYLASTFRRHYRCTVGEYLRQLRVEFACREISASDAPLAEIALAAGFSHQSHFSTTFKRITGMTPIEYRALARSS
jgi:AraC family transcriptional regulator